MAAVVVGRAKYVGDPGGPAAISEMLRRGGAAATRDTALLLSGRRREYTERDPGETGLWLRGDTLSYWWGCIIMWWFGWKSRRLGSYRL